MWADKNGANLKLVAMKCLQEISGAYMVFDETMWKVDVTVKNNIVEPLTSKLFEHVECMEWKLSGWEQWKDILDSNEAFIKVWSKTISCFLRNKWEGGLGCSGWVRQIEQHHTISLADMSLTFHDISLGR